MDEVKQAEKAAEVLVVGKHEYVLEKVEGILKGKGYSTAGSVEYDEVLKLLRDKEIDLLFIGGGIPPHERMGYLEFVQSQKPDVRVVEHFGGPATILKEVAEALSIRA